jgi:hypothetical protein
MAKKSSAKKVGRKRGLSDVHPGHSQHLCELVRERKMGRVAQLSKGATCICIICGRAAAKAANLCEAVDI